MIQYQQRRNSCAVLTKKVPAKKKNIKSIPPSKSNLLAESSVTKSQQNKLSYFSPNTVVTRIKHVDMSTYAFHTIIHPKKSSEATDDPT